jgi:hypothetical protein
MCEEPGFSVLTLILLVNLNFRNYFYRPSNLKKVYSQCIFERGTFELLPHLRYKGKVSPVSDHHAMKVYKGIGDTSSLIAKPLH